MDQALSPFETPGAALAAQAANRGQQEALAFPDAGGRLDFATWHEQATAVARGLLARGFAPGDHIALLAENRLEWPVVHLGVALMGGVLVPLNSHYRRDDLAFALKQSDSKAIFLSPAFRSNPYEAMVRELEGELPLLREVVAFDTPDGFAALLDQGRATARRPPRVEGGAIAALLYTSGTTGAPKGALLSHRAMLGNAWGTAQRLGLGPDDRWTSIIPLFHCAGCIMNLLGCLQTGACYVGLPAFEAEAMFRLIETERCTLLSGVPTSYLAMLRDPARARFDLGSLRAGTCGGAEADPRLLERCAEALPQPHLVQVYGQTEAATLVSCPAHDDPERLATAGPPLPGYELRITDPASGNPLPAGAVGQIEARGPMTMAGYYGRPEDTAEALDGEGWLKTGDLGTLNENGKLVIAGGRLRDMIIRGGENIYPSEIEAILIDHPAVEETAVFALPDDYYGETVAAAVRLGLDEKAENLAAHCAERIARFKVPARFYRVDAFPLTASGKIRKTALRQAARDSALEVLP